MSQSDKGFLVLSSACCSLFSSSMIIKMLREGRCVGRKGKGFLSSPSTSSSLWRSLPNIHPFHPSQSDSRLSREEDCVHKEKKGKDYFVLQDKTTRQTSYTTDASSWGPSSVVNWHHLWQDSNRMSWNSRHVCRFHPSLHVKCIVNVQCLLSNPYHYRHHMEAYCYEDIIFARIS